MRRRALRVVLAVVFGLSLILNAVVVGAALRLWHARGDRPAVMLGIDPELRRDLRAAFRDDAEIVAARARLSEARSTLSALLSAPDADRAALESATGDVRRATTALQEALHRRMLEFHAAR